LAAAAATLFMFTGDSRYRARAEQALRHLGSSGAQDVVGAASLQSAFDTLLRGRVAFVVGAGDEAAALLQLTSAEADPALFSAQVSPEAIRKGHPAEGKRPTHSSAALFLCDAFRCLPEIATDKDAIKELSATRRGLVNIPAG
jgi:uncharacterized protein YyaL (SSP411 family)